MHGAAAPATFAGPARDGETPRRLAIALAGAALIGLQAWLALTHLPWRDETQAWQIAIRSASLADLFANLRYEGHPALWYLLLRAASALSSAPEMLALVQAAVATATLALLLGRSPLPPGFRLAVGASYLVLFEYGTIARSYGLGALLLFAALAWRHRPAGWLCLCLMANVSAHSLLLSAACAALFWRDGWREPAGIALWLAGCLAAALTLWPAPDAAPAVVLHASLSLRFAAANLGFSPLIAPFDPFVLPASWPSVLSDPWGSPVGALVPVVVWFALRREPRAAATGLALWAAVTATSLLAYPAATRHAGIVFLYVVSAEWLRADRTGEAPSRASLAWAGLSAAFGLLMAASALSQPFTAGRAAADWARREGVAGEAWAVYPGHEIPVLAAEIGRPVYDPGHRCLADFNRWDRAGGARLDAHALSERLAEAAQAAGGRLHLLAEAETLPPGIAGLQLLATLPAGLGGFGKLVFRVDAPDSGPAGPGLPRCPWTAPAPP